jgi:hypothetical protein
MDDKTFFKDNMGSAYDKVYLKTISAMLSPTFGIMWVSPVLAFEVRTHQIEADILKQFMG